MKIKIKVWKTKIEKYLSLPSLPFPAMNKKQYGTKRKYYDSFQYYWDSQRHSNIDFHSNILDIHTNSTLPIDNSRIFVAPFI